MKAASVCTASGLTLISGALVAATMGLTGGAMSFLQARFDAIDTDGSREITRSEARVSAGLVRHFAQLDRNGDGIVSWAEFRRRGVPEIAS